MKKVVGVLSLLFSACLPIVAQTQVQISSGGGPVGGWVADKDFSGGNASSVTALIDTSGMTNPAPMAVYQSERWGVFSYTIPNLTPGGTYTVRLHFAELAYRGPGKRVFNVAINGSTVLSNFDIFATAGASNKAVVEQFTTTADATGKITIAYQKGLADQPKSSAIEIIPLAPHPALVQISSGGGPVGGWVADEDFSGGNAASTTATIDLSGVTNPAPMGVYQSERWGVFTYAIPNLTPGRSYQVRLHFAELAYGGPGKRVFNVAINGSTVLSNFDIFATAGASNKAVVEQFTTTADATGKITIAYQKGLADQPKSSAIEIIPLAPPPALVQISSGGGPVGGWVADEDFSGGNASSVTALIDTSGMTNPAPMAVYQSERWGVFSYTIPNLTPGGTYTVRLHFAELAYRGPGKRVFNVAINGSTVLSNFDIFATAGASNKAVVEQFTTTADATTGKITIAYQKGLADQPKSSGIEILRSVSAPAAAPAAAPSVATEPTSQTITVGQTATFKVVASGTAPLSYQWQKNGATISGATLATYATPAATSAENGETFRVVVKNSVGTVTSSAATLSVVSGPVPPIITKQPASQVAATGQVATFSVVASGTAPLTYQWLKNGANIAGASLASYTTPAESSVDNGSTFQVKVSNSAGQLMSAAATLTVTSPSTAVTTGSLAGGTVGTVYTGTLQASGGSTPYTWSISSGSLPAGLNLVASTGVISGTPTTAATASFTVQVKDAASNTATKSLSITVSASGTQPQTDQYGGLINVPCTNTNTAFAIVKVGSNLVFCTPQGHAMFARGFYVMDLNLGTSANETGGTYNQYVMAKYGTAQTWYTEELNRMQSWGMNSVGPYGNANLYPPMGQTTKVPFVLMELASGYSLVNKLGWGTGAAKEMYKLLSPQWGGFVGSTGIADYRDPNWAGMVSGVLKNDWGATTVAGASAANKGYLLGFTFDDSDGLHGFGAGPDFATQPAGDNDFRLGYMGFFIAPTDYANSSQGEIYPDATVYLKKRFHDMLVAKYGTVNGLNNAWGSGYSTLDSSGTCVGTAPVACASNLSAENVGTGNGSTKSFSATLAHTTISKFSLGIFVGGVLLGGDSGNGAIYGPGVSGSVNYSTGALSLSFGTAPGANAAITANYIQNGWGIGSGFMDEDCRSSHASYCGNGSGSTTIHLTGVSANAQTDVNALTQDIAAHYSSTINNAIQAWGAAHGFTGHIPYLGPTTLGTWSAPPDRYVLQGFAGNVDAWQYGGMGTFSQAELDFVNTYMGDVGLIEGEYRTANADSPYAWPNSPCTHSGSTVTCTIASPNHFSNFAGNFHIDSTCNNADYNISNVNYSATASTVTYSANGTPSEGSATCKVFFDDANVGGFATQDARGQDFFNKVSTLPARSFTATGTHPYVGYFWWQYFDNDAEKLDWGMMTLRDNAYDGNEAVNPIVVCSDPTQAYSCGGELRGPYGSLIPHVKSTNSAIDNTLLALP